MKSLPKHYPSTAVTGLLHLREESPFTCQPRYSVSQRCQQLTGLTDCHQTILMQCYDSPTLISGTMLTVRKVINQEKSTTYTNLPDACACYFECGPEVEVLNLPVRISHRFIYVLLCRISGTNLLPPAPHPPYYL